VPGENIIHGNVHGPVVQAHNIYGDVHVQAAAHAPRFAGVPPRVTNVVGREAELGELHDRLARSNAVVVTGLGGLGKTTLLSEYCHRHRADFRLVRWIVASSREATVDALLSLASALNVDTARLSAQDAIRGGYEALGASEGRWLIVFDNVDQPGWIEELLPVEPNAAVAITSRWRDWSGTGLPALALPTIGVDESVALLTTVTGREPDEVARRLALRLGGLSLAVRQAAVYCARTHCDFASYSRLLDERGVDMYRRDAALAAVLETSLTRVSELARAILNVCAFLAPTGIRSELFLRTFASNEPLLRYGDEILVRDALSELEQYSLLERAFQEDGRPVRFGVHRLVQELCRAAAGARREDYAQIAMRLMRRAGTGWDYYVADSGAVVVGVERGTGRLLVTRTADRRRWELPLPADAVDLPTSVEVGDSQVMVRYTDEVAVWQLDGTAARSPAPTHLLSDRIEEMDESEVRLPDGAVLTCTRVAPFWIYKDEVELETQLDPGWRGMRFLQAPLLVDPTGRWLLGSVYTTKIIDCGWIAAWLLDDLFAEGAPEVLPPEEEFYPNGADGEELYAGEPVKSMCFSQDGSRLYLLDQWTVHAWTWPDPDLLWRIPRPELEIDVLKGQLAEPVVCCTALDGTEVVRAALSGGGLVDVHLDDLSVEEVGTCADPLAISSGGAVLPRAGLRRAFAVDDGSFLVVTNENRLARATVDGVEPIASPAGELIAVHRSGRALLIRDGDWFRHVVLTEGKPQEVGKAAVCRAGSTDEPFPAVVVFADAELPLAVCKCFGGGVHDDIGSWWRLSRLWWREAQPTVVAADGDTAVVGDSHGNVTMWVRDGWDVDGYPSDAERFRVTVSAHPVRWLFLRLDIRVVLAVDDVGGLALLKWR
jgi:hypothetical protein